MSFLKEILVQAFVLLERRKGKVFAAYSVDYLDS